MRELHPWISAKIVERAFPNTLKDLKSGGIVTIISELSRLHSSRISLNYDT